MMYVDWVRGYCHPKEEGKRNRKLADLVIQLVNHCIAPGLGDDVRQRAKVNLSHERDAVSRAARLEVTFAGACGDWHYV